MGTRISNPPRRATTAGLALLALAALGAASVGADGRDWPEFRGPDRDGVSREQGLLTAWPVDGPRVLWRTELGNGYSGISVYKGRVFTMYGRGDDEFAVSLDADTGAKLWQFRTDANWRDRTGDGPRVTPTVAAGIVYVISARGKLFALNAGDGQPLWSHDLTAEFGAKPPTWGMASSPLVEGDLLLVQVGGRSGSGIVAFDRRTGKEVWRALDDAAGYAAPLAITVGDLRQVLFFTARNLVAVAPADGSLLWRVPWKTSYDVNAAMPVFIPPDRVFVSSGYDVGGALLRVVVAEGKAQVRELWKSREMKNQFSSSVLHDGHLYGFDDGTLKCIRAGSGETTWRQRGFGHGSLTYVDGHLIVMSDKGELALVEAMPAEYRERARARVFQGKTWTVPTFAAGRLYLRDERELIALDAKVESQSS